MRRITATIEVQRYSESTVRDAHGNSVASWTSTAVGVYAIAPKQSVEPDELGRRAVVTGLTVYAPLGTDVRPHDRVVLPHGVTYEVVGEIAVWDNNPHVPVTRNSGVQFDLERSTG